jgi:hypothetical protein
LFLVSLKKQRVRKILIQYTLANASHIVYILCSKDWRLLINFVFVFVVVSWNKNWHCVQHNLKDSDSTFVPFRKVPSCIYKGGDQSLVSNYRPVSLTLVVCKQMEHVMASYLRKIWDKRDWLFEGQHGFRSGYSCENQVITFARTLQTHWITEVG